MSEEQNSKITGDGEHRPRRESDGIKPMPVSIRVPEKASNTQKQEPLTDEEVALIHSLLPRLKAMNVEETDNEEPKRQPRKSFVNEYQRQLSEDTFSFLMFASYCLPSIPFCIAMAVFLSQMSIYFLVIFNTVDIDSNNPFRFPPDVDIPTRMAQVFAIVITVFTQEDIRTVFNLLRDGQKKKYFEEFEGYSRAKWTFSVVLRALEGSLSIFVTFLLIMQSVDVIELLLNFTAMEFVSHLDDVAFILATYGFATVSAQKAATTITDTKYYVGVGKTRSFRNFIFFCMLGGLLTGWFIILFNQIAGDYSCQSVFIQFSDEFVPDLGAFTGFYKFKRVHTDLDSYERYGSVRYEARALGNGNAAFLGYCKENEAWTFTIDGKDPCSNWIAKTDMPDASSFDILSAGSTEWLVKNSDNRTAVLSRFRLTCSDECDGDACYQESYGYREDLKIPCSSANATMDLWDRESVQPVQDEGLGNGFKSAHYNRLVRHNKSITVVFRPVYYSRLGNTRYVEIIMFNGRRWVLTSTASFYGCDACNNNTLDYNNTLDGLASYLNEEFHPYWSNYTMSLISDPVDVNTYTDVASPIQLRWFGVAPQLEGHRIGSADPLRPTTTSLLCGFPAPREDSYFDCDSDQVQLRVEVTTDEYPDEISWTLEVGDELNRSCLNCYNESGILEVTGPFCVSQNACVIFTIIDSFGDGIIAPGGYNIQVGDKFQQGGGFSYCESFSQNCDSLDDDLCDDIEASFFPSTFPPTPPPSAATIFPPQG